MVHPPVSLYLCIKRFPREIRKKVRKLLYHSLRTNVPKSVGIDTNKLFSLTATQGAEGDADFKKCRIFKGFQNFSSMFFFAT